LSLGDVETFGKKVGEVRMSINPDECDLAMDNSVANEMISKPDVFSTMMMNV
jgi:hypothetical protein